MSRYAGRIKGAALLIIAISLLILVRTLPIGEAIAALQAWVAGLGVWGPVVFGLIYIVAVVAMVPASLLTLAGGATFGLLIGTVTVSLASNIGAALALLIARYLARDRVEQFVRSRPRFTAIDQAIRDGGWKIVAMLRLSPAVPFNVQNYLYGLTSISFWTCVLTSWIAMLPGTFLYVYLGHAAGSVTGAASRTTAEWIMLAVGLLATIGVTVTITRLARRKLQKQTAFDDATPPLDDETPTQTESASGFCEADSRSPASAIVLLTAALLLAGLAGTSLVDPQQLTRLLPLGPPSVVMTEQYADAKGRTTFDHAAFDAVLHDIVDSDGWIDYERLAADPTGLDAYLQALQTAPFDELDRDGKLALLINAYNACTLQLIVDYWPIDSIKDIPADRRWDDPRWRIAGQTWSLNQIEHDQIRPKFREPRIHFALVCAAVGCPPLAETAYEAADLESQLQQQAEYVHQHDTWLRLDPHSSTVSLTPLYRWYVGDFEQSADSVIDYASRFNKTLRHRLASGETFDVTFLPYDWSLNSTANRRPR